MLEQYLVRPDVVDFMKQLKTSERYFQKSSYGFLNHSLCVSSELALYIFYDALLKYKIIIDDESLLGEYLDQMQRLYRKLNDFESIRFGIHKLLAKMISMKYDIHEWRGEERNQLISILYSRYIENGYYFHGFHSAYLESIEKNGFIPEYYDNYYDRFLKVNSIFQKYHVSNAINKDFVGTNVFFTDDSLLGCYYSMYAPMYFMNFIVNSSLFGSKVQMNDFLEGNFEDAIQPLKKYMNKRFQEEDKKYVLDLVQDEWNYLHSDKQELCLLMIPRKKMNMKEIPIEEYLNDNGDIFEIVDRILSSKCNSISSNEVISRQDIEIVTFPNYYEEKLEKTLIIDMKEEYSNKEKPVVGVLNNAYGHGSLLLLAGSLSVSFGVILSIFTVLGG